LSEARRLQKGSWVPQESANKTLLKSNQVVDENSLFCLEGSWVSCQEKVVPQPSKTLFKCQQVVSEKYCQEKIVSQIVSENVGGRENVVGQIVPQPSESFIKSHQVVSENASHCQEKIASRVVNVKMMHEVAEIESDENEIVDLDQYELSQYQPGPLFTKLKPDELVFLDPQPIVDASQIFLDDLSSVYLPDCHAFQEKFSKIQPLPIQRTLQPIKRRSTSLADIVAMQPSVAKKPRLRTEGEYGPRQLRIVSAYAKNDSYKTKDDGETFVPKCQDPFLSGLPDNYQCHLETLKCYCPESNIDLATGQSLLQTLQHKSFGF